MLNIGDKVKCTFDEFIHIEKGAIGTIVKFVPSVLRTEKAVENPSHGYIVEWENGRRYFMLSIQIKKMEN